MLINSIVITCRDFQTLVARECLVLLAQMWAHCQQSYKPACPTHLVFPSDSSVWSHIPDRQTAVPTKK